MAGFRSASALLLFLAFAVFLFPLTAHGTCYEPLCCTYPPIQGTTHIESVSPQVALPGVTVVYIQGYCFGDSKGTGSITLNGEPMTDIVFWTDAEIAFRLPFDAKSDNLVVTSSYGSDSTANEANCQYNPPPGWTPDYCGNGKINATFSIAPVGPPIYPDPATVLGDTAWAPEYVQGTWNFDDGSETMTLTLNQGPFNATNGTWPITGTEVDNFTGQYNVWGTLDQYGDLALCLAFYGASPSGIEWLVLGSGDVTSQGLNHGITCTASPVPTKDFLRTSMDVAEGPYYDLGVAPLFKSATDKPPGETVTPLSPWLTIEGSLPTAKAWERTFPLLNSLPGYTGRFVYEQSDGIAASDGCYYGDPGGPAKVTNTLTGGGWYVDPQGMLGADQIGMGSTWVSYYQNHYGPMGQTCAINTPQDLYIDTRIGPEWVPWVTDGQVPADILPKELFVGLAPEEGALVTACEPYPNTGRGKCK